MEGIASVSKYLEILAAAAHPGGSFDALNGWPHLNASCYQAAWTVTSSQSAASLGKCRTPGDPRPARVHHATPVRTRQ